MSIRSIKENIVDDTFTAGTETSGRSLMQSAMLRFYRNKAAMVSLVILCLLILLAIFGPYFVPFNYEDPDWSAFRAPPSLESGHYFGADQNGRDLLARTLYGTRVSLTVAFVATIVSVFIGVSYGAIAGYLGGRVDQAMMRFVDIMYALPYILFVILVCHFANGDFWPQCVFVVCCHWGTGMADHGADCARPNAIPEGT